MPVVTRHGKTRLKQRAGINKNNASRCAKKVYKHGLRHRDVTGSLHEFMTAIYMQHENANNSRIYGDSIYLFHNAILITVMKIPDSIYQKLESETKPEAYQRYMDYKKYRKSQCKRKEQ